MSMTKTSLSVLVLSALLAACSSTPEPAPEAAAPAPAPAPQVAEAPPAPAPAPVPEVPVAKVVPPEVRSVFFDFDKSAVKNDYVQLIELHGRFLAANPDLAIRIEGNADERGSAEYNLALGQRRAESVLRALKTYGVKDSQAEPVSWGEEKPRASGHDESAWSQNRRADLAYPMMK